MSALAEVLVRGGPAMWAIAALSVATLALILWKVWTLSRAGLWRQGGTDAALSAWAGGDEDRAVASLRETGGLRADLALAAMQALADPALDEAAAREETARIAKASLAEAREGLRALDMIAAIAPLIGLLGTVLGMIEAFQALQEAGAAADPAALAGGIWQALLTTAAGMAVAIPAYMAASWLEGAVDRAQADMEDLATRIFTRRPGAAGRRAAE